MLARMWTHGWICHPSYCSSLPFVDCSYRPNRRENYSRDGRIASTMRKQSQDECSLSGAVAVLRVLIPTKARKARSFWTRDCTIPKEFQEFCGADFCAEAITERARQGGQPQHIFKAQNSVAQGSLFHSMAPSAAAQVFQLLQMRPASIRSQGCKLIFRRQTV